MTFNSYNESGYLKSSSRDDSLIGKIKKILDDENIDSEIIKRSDKMTTSNVDIVITAGGDRAILDYSHYVKEFYTCAGNI